MVKRIFDMLLVSFALGVMYCIFDIHNYNTLSFICYISSFLALIASILLTAYYISKKNEKD